MSGLIAGWRRRLACSAVPDQQAGAYEREILVLYTPCCRIKALALIALLTCVASPMAQNVETPNCTITGNVVRADTGAPVAGQILFNYDERFESPRSTATVEDGSFKLANLQSACVYLYVAPTTPTLCHAGPLVMVDLRQQNHVENLVLKVEEGCAIRGTLLDADGKPVANHEIIFRPWGPFYRPVRTGGAGQFFLRNLGEPNKAHTLEIPTESADRPQFKLDPVAKGTVAENVVIRLPKTPAKGVLRGTVADREGRPLTDVILQLKAPGAHLTRSDSQGRFEIPFFGAGDFVIGGNKELRLENCGRPLKLTFLEGARVTLTEGQQVEDFRVVVDVEPYIQGAVRDEQGQGLKAQIEVLPYGVRPRLMNTEDGQFAATDLPSAPFLLEFTKPGFRAQVLESGRSFQPGDHDIQVVLKKALFKPDESVFEAVTGCPETPEGTAGMPCLDEVRERCAKYRDYAAMPCPETLARAAGKRPPQAEPAPVDTPKMRVTDPQGNPITRIYVDDGCSMLPGTRSATRVLDGADGLFSYSPGLLWAEGTGQARVPAIEHVLGAPPAPSQAQPYPVVLYPAAVLVLHVADAAGNPLADIAAVPPDEAAQLSCGGSISRIAKSDATGTITFDRLAPGYYSFVLAKEFPEGTHGAPFVCKVEPGKAYERRVTFGPPKEGTPEALLEALRVIFAQDARERQIQPKLEAPLARAVATLIAERIEEMPASERWEVNELRILTAIAQELSLTDIVPALEHYLTRWQGAKALSSRYDTFTAPVAATVAKLAGDDAVDFLAGLAADPQRAYVPRRDAIIALGQLASEKSVAAFKKLRDAAYAKPGAPQRKESYTHEERMIEAVKMTLDIIPDAKPGESLIERAKPTGMTDVSADYTKGSVGFSESSPYGAFMSFNLVRRGDEWMVSEIGGVGMP